MKKTYYVAVHMECLNKYIAILLQSSVVLFILNCVL
jgi:hypothetical protein